MPSDRPGEKLTRIWRLLPVLALLTLMVGWSWSDQTQSRTPDEVVWLAPDQEALALSDKLGFLREPEAGLTVAEVASAAWEDHFRFQAGSTLNLGVTQDTYWLRLRLGRRGGPEAPLTYVLSLRQPFLTYAAMYLQAPGANGEKVWAEIPALSRAGRSVDLPSRFIHFRLSLEPGQPQTYYLRLRSLVALNLIPEIASEVEYVDGLIRGVLIYGGLAGILLALAGYHGIVFFTMSNRAYLWYVAMMAMAIIYFLGMNGIFQVVDSPAKAFVNRDLPNLALGLMFAFRVLFAKSFLPLKNRMPRCNHGLTVLFLAALTLSGMTVFEPTRLLAIKSFMALGLLLPLVVMPTALVCWRSGFSPARIFLFAYLFSGAGSMIFVVGLVGRLSLPLSLYHTHQLALCAEAFLLALALRDRIKSLRQEQEAMRQYADATMRDNQAKLRSLVGQLVNAEERQRRRIAEDLHDSVTQDLTAGVWRLRNLGQTLEELERAELEEVGVSLDRSLRDLRSLTFEISPPELYDYGLASALEALAERIAKRHDLALEVSQPDPLPRLTEEVEVALYRMTRELLRNVVKHAGAKRVAIGLNLDTEQVWVTVQDDGLGFDPGRLQVGGGEGFGLFSIRERLHGMGGSLEVESRLNRGTRVSLAVPLITASPKAGGER